MSKRFPVASVLPGIVLAAALLPGPASAQAPPYLTQWNMWSPVSIAVDGSSDVYAVDGVNDFIRKFTCNGVDLLRWDVFGYGNGQLNGPYGVAVDATGIVYVADGANNRVQKFTSAGVYLAQWGTYGNGNGQFRFPTGIAVDGGGNVYVADRGNGVYLTKWGGYGAGNGLFNGPVGVAVDEPGNVYVTDSDRIQVFGYPTVSARSTSWGRIKAMYR